MAGDWRGVRQGVGLCGPAQAEGRWFSKDSPQGGRSHPALKQGPYLFCSTFQLLYQPDQVRGTPDDFDLHIVLKI